MRENFSRLTSMKTLRSECEKYEKHILQKNVLKKSGRKPNDNFYTKSIGWYRTPGTAEVLRRNHFTLYNEFL